jgi:superfamily II DNA or RNA helicase
LKLYPFQEEAVEAHIKALDSCGASLDGTECGGGKTVIAAATAARYGLPTAVICPKSVLAKWEMTLNEFGVSPLFVLNPEKLRGGRTPWLKKDGKKFRWEVPDGTLMVFD